MSKEANPSRSNPVKSSERPEKPTEKSVPEQKVSPAAEEKSPLGNFHYAVLMEMNDTECEAWYNFIRLEGNEDALRHLNQQLETVRWRLEDDLSTFDLDLEHPVTEQTAREMIRLDLNHSCPHRMFCGKLETIDLKLKPEYKNLKKMEKVFDVLGEGGIENFIEDEYVDPRDMADSNESESESESSTGSSSSESEKAPSPAGKKPANKKKQLIEVPRYAKAKKHHK